MTRLIASKMQEGVASGVFAGGVLRVCLRGQVVFFEAFGAASVTPQHVEMTRDTVFDLASLTKPLATAAATLLLIQTRVLALTDPVCKFVPEFVGARKETVTLRHLLNHSAGLPAWRPYAQDVRGKPGLYARVCAEALIARPGTQSLYSDLGFILLGAVIEAASGEPLDTFCDRRLFAQSGCKTAQFSPRLSPDASRHRFAATSVLPQEGALCGVVDDDNARAAGGVAGHAGLFADAADVDRLTRLWTDSLTGGGPFDPDLATLFVTRQRGDGVPPRSTWGLGWDTPSRPGSSSGRFFSAASFGHLGFTGTSLWVDRKHDLRVILLTNRVHPDRQNQKMKAFRPRLHDVIFRETIGGVD